MGQRRIQQFTAIPLFVPDLKRRIVRFPQTGQNKIQGSAEGNRTGHCSTHQNTPPAPFRCSPQKILQLGGDHAATHRLHNTERTGPVPVEEPAMRQTPTISRLGNVCNRCTTFAAIPLLKQKISIPQIGHAHAFQFGFRLWVLGLQIPTPRQKKRTKQPEQKKPKAFQKTYVHPYCF